MPDLDDLGRRVQRLENAVDALREREVHNRAEIGTATSTAADASRLARGASLDVSNVEEAWRGHNRVLEALRATQLEQGEQIDANFAEVKADVAEMKAGMQQIVALLGRLTGDETT